jgi:nicotinate-nucleotide adenylyltransferase
LRGLRLDEVWWLVSPQNPLKPLAGMAAQADRVAAATALACHPRLRVTGLEARLGTRYTADTLRLVFERFPAGRFVWLMGADNLRQIPLWDRWVNVFKSVAVAVFDRSPYSYRALAGKAAVRFGGWRVPSRRAAAVVERMPPAWVYLHMRRHPASASAIRRSLAGQDGAPPEQAGKAGGP